MMEELHSEFLENLMPGIEVIIGRNGKHYFNSLLTDFDEKYMMKWFTRGDYATEMTKVSCFKFQFIMISTSIQIYESLALEEHKMNLYGGLEVARQMQQQQGEGQVNLGLEKDVTSSQENLDIKDGGFGVGDIPKSPSVMEAVKSVGVKYFRGTRS